MPVNPYLWLWASLEQILVAQLTDHVPSVCYCSLRVTVPTLWPFPTIFRLPLLFVSHETSLVIHGTHLLSALRFPTSRGANWTSERSQAPQSYLDSKRSSGVHARCYTSPAACFPGGATAGRVRGCSQLPAASKTGLRTGLLIPLLGS